MSRTVWMWARLVGPAVAIAVLVWRLGAGPFVDGVHTVRGPTLAAAAALGVLITVCCAWRWKLVARGLGVDLPLRDAIASYYRSQFLNATLPGGVVGDVHRGVSHGRDVSDIGRGLRAVAWERAAGQAVQIVLTVAVLLTLPSPVRSSMPLVALVGALAMLAVIVAVRVRPEDARSRWARLRNAAAGDIRDGLIARRAWLGIAATSALAVAGFAATFLVAARTAGTDAPVSRMLPIALIVMLAMVLPNVAGWGPREGVTAWAFGAAGLGVDRGVATAVVFGVMTLVASLPGAAVLIVVWLRGTEAPGRPEPAPRSRAPIGLRPDGAVDA